MTERLMVTTCKLGVGQILAWGSVFYLPAILSRAMSASLGVSTSVVFAAFSCALLVLAFVGPFAGRYIDRHGGRSLMLITNVIFAVGLLLLGAVQNAVQLFAVWLLLGVAMGAGLYEAAFATMVRLHGTDARRAITGITLFGGFASTFSWPVTTWLLGEVGWRQTCWVWAAVHVLILLPLNATLPRAQPREAVSQPVAPAAAAPVAGAEVGMAGQRMALVWLALAFSTVYFMGTSMMTHLPDLLMVGGASAAAAVAAAALVGPSQIIGRIADYKFLQKAHPLWSARLAVLAYPIAASVALLLGPSVGWVYAVIFGLGNGIMTVVVGTLPLAMFGAQGYGQRQGLLMVPARLAQASAPLLFGLAVERWQFNSLWIVVGLASLAGLAFWRLKPNTAKAQAAPVSAAA